MRLLPAFALAATLATAAAQAAPMVSWTGSSDAAFLAHLSGLGVSLPANEVAVAQARGGNNALNGDYEIGLHVPPSFTNAGPVGTAGQVAWGSQGGNNGYLAFTLSRVGTTLTFSMGGYTGSYTNAEVADINGLALRVGAGTQGNRVGSTDVRNLVMDGVGLGSYGATGAGGVSLAVIEGFSGDFTLTGEAALNWTGGAAIPSGSRLAFQIKAIEGLPVAVPEPAALALLGVGLAGLAWARLAWPRRRRA